MKIAAELPLLTEPERSCLERYLDVLRDALGDDLLQVFVYGSVARGESWPAGMPIRSDLDLLVVTADPVPEDVVAMAEAAACCRTAGLVIAESEALTWVGRCEPGDVLGISDGEVVLIAPDLPVGALWLAHRMLVGGGEIVTALLGRGVPDEVGEGLVADLRRTHPEVDTVVLRGNRTDYPLVLGVE